MAHEEDGRNVDPGTRVILEELRDLRLEMRADRERSDERNTRILERMDRKLGARGNGHPGQDNGRST